jgi:molybdenum cofactor biosynthesis enzyme MoaA
MLSRGKFLLLTSSITDVCNFRCTYCLPDGYKPGSVTNNGFLPWMVKCAGAPTRLL